MVFFPWKLGVTQSRPLLETQSSWPFKSNLRLRRDGPQTYIGCSVFSPPKNRKNNKFNSHPKTEFCCKFQYALFRTTKAFIPFRRCHPYCYFHPVHGFRRSVEGSKYPNLGWRKLWPGWHENISRWLVHGGWPYQTIGYLQVSVVNIRSIAVDSRNSDFIACHSCY